METSMKIYKELCYIVTFDNEVIATAEDMQTLSELVNRNKFLDLWGGELINVSTIKKIVKKELDDVDNAILQITDQNLRKRVQKRIDERRTEGSRVNIDILNNVIERIKQEW